MFKSAAKLVRYEWRSHVKYKKRVQNINRLAQGGNGLRFSSLFTALKMWGVTGAREVSAYSSLRSDGDFRYIPSNFYKSGLSRYLNRSPVADWLDDKANLSVAFPGVTPDMLSLPQQDERSELDIDDAVKSILLSQKNGVVIKDSAGQQGKEVIVLTRDEADAVSLRSAIKSIKGGVVVQHRLSGHYELQRVNSDSLNTIRAITLSWRDRIYYLGAFARFGRKGVRVDNVHSGGLFANSTEGSKAERFFDGDFVEYDCHPDSGVRCDEIKSALGNLGEDLPEFSVSLHERYPQVGLIGWDLVPENGGFSLLEANAKVPAAASLQILNGPLIPEEIFEEIYWSCVSKRH
ncbi:sugar-transfer associated ATP-grasp domain-containing protein [Thioalkalivibrio sp. ALJ16]|uniref:sugar-transfer associated ATP-grasp domain-containing protein n=1 Tax=Thioalkalivibrio sp. ALJ16 TaxID=1158762 RepID=UPI0018CA38C2|nr:sugar-transfer associated ATP-grasp domain-containing protein [Thioalkalivibrio sp. ALJ16]